MLKKLKLIDYIGIVLIAIVIIGKYLYTYDLKYINNVNNEISKMTKMEIYNITLLISAIYTYIIIYIIIHIINYSINKITKSNNKK